MFLNGIHHDDQRFRDDAQAISKFVLACMVKYQRERPPEIQDGGVTAHCILAGTAFSVGTLIHKLPQRERNKLREYFVHKLDEMLREHGA